MDSIRRAYDQVPYPSLPWRSSHPVWVGSLGALYGLDPVNPAKCRFLEVGCSTGGNLIPLAAAYPESSFVGVDLSPVQVDAGNEVIACAGLTNVDLRALSLTAIDERFGEFDYIIAHGVFSWVPDDVRHALLRLCRERLTPEGLAFVSYNTYPGWHQKQMVREMLVRHTGGIADASLRTEEAARFLEFLAGEVPGRKSQYDLALQDVWDQVREGPIHYFAHEYLAEDNRPLHFTDFAALSARFGLRYVAEANHTLMHLQNLPPEQAERLLSFGDDRILVEQNLDYLRGRLFRQSILCRVEKPVPPMPHLVRLTGMHLAAEVRPVNDDPDLASEEFVEFIDADGATTRIAQPLAKAALVVMGEAWPRAFEYPDLVEAAADRIPGVTGEAADPVICAGVLGVVWASGLLEAQATPYPFAREVPERPRATLLARFEAMAGGDVTNLRHGRVEFEEALPRKLLGNLTGVRDAAELARDLREDEEAVRGALRSLGKSALLQA